MGFSLTLFRLRFLLPVLDGPSSTLASALVSASKKRDGFLLLSLFDLRFINEGSSLHI
jgi:hypothetical protein